MAKVLIYEDGEDDLIARYASLTSQHDVHVRHDPRGDFGPSSLKWENERFRKHGFNPDYFQNGYGNPKEESADVYFVDGLKGYCFEILKNLPRDRAFINTDSPSIVDEAKQKDFNVVGNESVDVIVERIIGRN